MTAITSAGRLGLNLVVVARVRHVGVIQRETPHATTSLRSGSIHRPGPSTAISTGSFSGSRVGAYPKPYGEIAANRRERASSEVGQAFALRNCDAFFVATAGSRTSLEGNAKKVTERAAQNVGREIEGLTVGQVICRPSPKEAEDYYRHAIIENADWGAIDGMLADEHHVADNPRPTYSRSGSTSRPMRSAATLRRHTRPRGG